MSTALFIKPKKGMKVRNPDRSNEHVPAYGAQVARNSYWLRRLRDGDVNEIEQADFEKAKAAHLKKEQAAAKKIADEKAVADKAAAEEKKTNKNSEAE